MIKEFVDYLVKISQKSYALLLDRFSDVFEQINERIANSGVCHTSLGPVYEFVCISFRTDNLNCFRAS